MRIFISLLVIAVCAVRTVSYAIYTFKEKNTAGTVSLMALIAGVIAIHVYLLF